MTLKAHTAVGAMLLGPCARTIAGAAHCRARNTVTPGLREKEGKERVALAEDHILQR